MAPLVPSPECPLYTSYDLLTPNGLGRAGLPGLWSSAGLVSSLGAGAITFAVLPDGSTKPPLSFPVGCFGSRESKYGCSFSEIGLYLFIVSIFCAIILPSWDGTQSVARL